MIKTLILAVDFSTIIFMIYFLIIFLYDCIFIYSFESQLITKENLLLNSLHYKEEMIKRAKEHDEKIAREEAEEKARREQKDDDHPFISRNYTLGSITGTINRRQYITGNDGITSLEVTEMRDSRTGEPVYYRDGEYVDADGKHISESFRE